MEIQELKGIEIQKDFIKDVLKNNKYNQEVILDYYYRLHSEDTTLNLTSNLENVSNCNSWWLLDYYQEQKVKDFKKTNLCKDKFCNNCKKVKQASRLSKFMPLIEEYKKDNYLYHITLTVPNCEGSCLSSTIKTMFESFRKLVRYLALDKNIKGLDFEQYGYIGAIRSLEVTFKGDSYHPHLHCIFAFNSPLMNNRYIENTFSNSRKNGYRKFTDFEVLIQKIWSLLNNKVKVTKKNIEELELGYSCTVDDIDESSVYEVFKYMTKSTDEESNILTYDNFKTLYFALYRVRQIQGYGCFYNVKDDDSIINEVDALYEVYVELLKAKENPLEVSQTPEELLNDDSMIISRKKIYSYLKSL